MRMTRLLTENKLVCFGLLGHNRTKKKSVFLGRVSDTPPPPYGICQFCGCAATCWWVPHFMLGTDRIDDLFCFLLVILPINP